MAKLLNTSLPLAINEVSIFVIRKVLQVDRMGVEYLEKFKKNKKKEFFSKRMICFS